MENDFLNNQSNNDQNIRLKILMIKDDLTKALVKSQNVINHSVSEKEQLIGEVQRNCYIYFLQLIDKL